MVSFEIIWELLSSELKDTEFLACHRWEHGDRDCLRHPAA